MKHIAFNKTIKKELPPFLEIPPVMEKKPLPDKPRINKQTTSIQVPDNKGKRWKRLADESGMTKAKYARSAVVHAIESGLTFREVKTVSVKVIPSSSHE